MGTSHLKAIGSLIIAACLFCIAPSDAGAEYIGELCWNMGPLGISPSQLKLGIFYLGGTSGMASGVLTHPVTSTKTPYFGNLVVVDTSVRGTFIASGYVTATSTAFNRIVDFELSLATLNGNYRAIETARSASGGETSLQTGTMNVTTCDSRPIAPR